MLGDAGGHIREPGMPINVVETGSLDQGVEDGRTPAAAIGSAE